MSSLVEAAEKEVMRNEILKICQEAAPQGASVQVLCAGIKKMGIEAVQTDVEKQLSYLEGKNLIRLQTVQNDRIGIRRVIAYITPAGTDLLEGNASAVGIANS